eukprot:scaffold111092_cov26-Prasinocladus_malaysianus.AAC.1
MTLSSKTWLSLVEALATQLASRGVASVIWLRLTTLVFFASSSKALDWLGVIERALIIIEVHGAMGCGHATSSATWNN